MRNFDMVDVNVTGACQSGLVGEVEICGEIWSFYPDLGWLHRPSKSRNPMGLRDADREPRNSCPSPKKFPMSEKGIDR